MKIDKKTAELGMIGAVAAVAIILYWNTYSFMPSMLPGYPGDAFFPRIILIFMLACAVAASAEIVLPGLRRNRSDEARRSIEVDIIAIGRIGAVVIIYALALSYVGFEISTFAFVVVLLTPALAGSRIFALAKAAGVALAAVIVLYFCFVVFLDVDFPLLFLPRYLQF